MKALINLLIGLKSKKINTILTNWKTSLGGIALIASGISVVTSGLSDGYQAEEFETLSAAIGGIIAGFTLLFARDADKRSEDQP